MLLSDKCICSVQWHPLHLLIAGYASSVCPLAILSLVLFHSSVSTCFVKYKIMHFAIVHRPQSTVVRAECYMLISETKKKSLANTLRKRFARGKDGPRAQSVERLPAPYDSNLLRPPDSVEASRVSGN